MVKIDSVMCGHHNGVKWLNNCIEHDQRFVLIRYAISRHRLLHIFIGALLLLGRSLNIHLFLSAIKPSIVTLAVPFYELQSFYLFRYFMIVKRWTIKYAHKTHNQMVKSRKKNNNNNNTSHTNTLTEHIFIYVLLPLIVIHFNLFRPEIIKLAKICTEECKT